MDPSTMDILTDAGFANAVYYTLRTRVGGEARARMLYVGVHDSLHLHSYSKQLKLPQ